MSGSYDSARDGHFLLLTARKLQHAAVCLVLVKSYAVEKIQGSLLFVLYLRTRKVYRVAKIIGCSERTIRWDIAKGRLFATLQERKCLVSKYSLIIKRNEAASSLVSE